MVLTEINSFFFEGGTSKNKWKTLGAKNTNTLWQMNRISERTETKSAYWPGERPTTFHANRQTVICFGGLVAGRWKTAMSERWFRRIHQSGRGNSLSGPRDRIKVAFFSQLNFLADATLLLLRGSGGDISRFCVVVEAPRGGLILLSSPTSFSKLF